MNDIYQQLGAQLSQRGQQGQGNPYASLMQQRPSPMPQMNFGGGAAGNPYAGLMRNLGQQAQMPPGGGQQPYGSIQMPTMYGRGPQGGLGSGLAQAPGSYPMAPGIANSLSAGLAQRFGSSAPSAGSAYQMPAADQRNPYASTTPQAMDGTGWKDGMSPQAFQVANPYYGQTGYYGDLAQVQAQMAGKAQSAGIPQGVLGASTYTQNPAGQTPWVPDLTPQQKVDQDLANWEANRWNPK